MSKIKTKEELGLFIAQQREKLGLSKWALRQKVKITNNTQDNLENNGNANISTLFSVVDALGLELFLNEKNQQHETKNTTKREETECRQVSGSPR